MRYKRILIWEVNWIGDVLFSTPFIKAIRDKFPKAHIAVITVPRCKEILDVNPNVDEVLVYDEKNIHRNIIDKWRIIHKLRLRHFDVVFLLHRSLTRTIITYLSGIKQRIGYSYRKRDIFLTHRIKNPIASQHRIEYFLGLARKVGADVAFKGLEFYSTKEDISKMEQFLTMHKVKNGDKVIAVNPGGNWNSKRWPVKKFAGLCDRMIKELGVKVIVTGAEKDVDIYLEIQDMMDEKLISACGKTTLRQLGALFSKCDIVISADSGPMHVALAVGAKVISLFGPTSPAITGPYGNGEYVVIQKDVGCRIPCYNLKCMDLRCMDSIEVDDVIQEAKRMARKAKSVDRK